MWSAACACVCFFFCALECRPAHLTYCVSPDLCIQLKNKRFRRRVLFFALRFVAAHSTAPWSPPKSVASSSNVPYFVGSAYAANFMLDAVNACIRNKCNLRCEHTDRALVKRGRKIGRERDIGRMRTNETSQSDKANCTLTHTHTLPSW